MNSRNQAGKARNEIRKTLGILQAGRAPDELIDRFPDYNQAFVNLLGADAFNYRHWAVLDNEFPNSIEDADAWLITGSRHGAYEAHDWIPPLESLIRQIQAKALPLVGICFGHQIIAQALGGKVEKFTGGWSVGRVEYELDSALFGNSADPQNQTPLLAFHQDQVTQAPQGAINVGRSPFCEHAALVYGSSILTIQPHPEFDNAFIDGLLKARGDILPKAILEQANKSLHMNIERESVAKTLRDFLNGNSVQIAHQATA